MAQKTRKTGNSKAKKEITIYDIAREARVSPATVSRILTGATRVSPEKQERVHALMTQYHFRPNAIARALTEPQTHLIGVLVADAGNPYYSSVYTALENEAFRRGYVTLMMNTQSKPEYEIAMLTKLRELRPDAIIVCGGRIDPAEPDEKFSELISLAQETTHLVAASCSHQPDMPGVAIDHTAAMELAMRYLMDLGHRKIGFIYAGEHNYGTEERLTCFRNVVQREHLPFCEEWLIHVDGYDMASGVNGAKRMMQCAEMPTAVLGMNDMISVGILHGLLQANVRVPEEMSVLGFDDTFVNNLTLPELTSVSCDYKLFASMLLDAALFQGSTEEVPTNQQVPVYITERGSCQSIKKE